MGNELKIVLIVIAIYLVLGFQNLINTSVFLIPYELNPLVIIGVSAISIVNHFRRVDKKSPALILYYFIGIVFYGLLSTRTLSLLYNNFQKDVFNVIANNDFTALIAILVFYIAIIAIVLKIRSKSLMFYVSLSLLLLSFVGAMINLELIQIICFTLFVLSLIIYEKNEDEIKLRSTFLAVLYQLFLFILLENTYFILIRYC